VFDPHPEKEKVPRCGGPVPGGQVPAPGGPAGRDRAHDSALAPLPRPRTPLPGLRTPGEPRPGLRKSAGATGPRVRRLHHSSSSPRGRGRGALTPPPASLSHPQRPPPFPAAQPSLALTWFKSSHKTRTASWARPHGAASADHWLIYGSWARLVGK
jgi:hypothetical protein